MLNTYFKFDQFNCDNDFFFFFCHNQAELDEELQLLDAWTLRYQSSSAHVDMMHVTVNWHLGVPSKEVHKRSGDGIKLQGCRKFTGIRWMLHCRDCDNTNYSWRNWGSYIVTMVVTVHKLFHKALNLMTHWCFCYQAHKSRLMMFSLVVNGWQSSNYTSNIAHHDWYCFQPTRSWWSDLHYWEVSVAAMGNCLQQLSPHWESKRHHQ